MQLFQVLQLLDPELEPRLCKIHLATHNGKDDPLREYIAGRFDEWQRWQTGRRFNRRFVVSLIAMRQPKTWLFAGAHDSDGYEEVPGREALYRYLLHRRDGLDELEGQLVVRFHRPGRNSYLRGETWSHALQVAEIRPEKVQVEDFPGYAKALIGKEDLDIVVEGGIESWRSALSNVAGVYVIADRTTGKLYVGSATGRDGIWGRWCSYSRTGHGDNAELKELLKREGEQHARNFQFGVLEIADSHASDKDVVRREQYWKQLLLSRAHGNNGN